jgi:hypothetical protein
VEKKRRRNALKAKSVSDSTGGHVRFTKHWLENDFLRVRIAPFEDMLLDDPDELDPAEEFRDEDGFWNIRFEVRADLKREAHTKLGLPIIVHDEARVYDVAKLGLQAAVQPGLFVFAAHIISNVAETLVAHVRTKGARTLIESFLASADEFGLNDAGSVPVLARIGAIQTVQEAFAHAARTLILGHEIGHHLVQSRARSEAAHDDNDEIELECDVVGLQAASFFHERYSNTVPVHDEDGTDVEIDEGIRDAWTFFEFLATALFFGDALRRRTTDLLESKTSDVFSLATRRCDAMIHQFRSSELGRLWPAAAPVSTALRQAFLDIDGFLGRTIDLRDDRYQQGSLRRDTTSMMGDCSELKSYFFGELRTLGVETELGVLVSESSESAGLERWRRVVGRATKNPPRPVRSRPIFS